MKRILSAAAFGLAALAIASPASAQLGRSDSRVWYGDSRSSYIEARRAAYDNGYREGLREGQKEGRQRDEFSYRDERTFRNADKGYHREYGDRERYRQAFRSGYADGYAEAYRRSGYRGRDDRGYGSSGYGGYNNQGGYG